MQRKQENKLKNNKKKDLEGSVHQKSVRNGDKKHYQTSTSNYMIRINHPHHNQETQPEKAMGKTHKKRKFLTQDIQQSQFLLSARSLGARKEMTLKISTLDNLEDLNVYQKCKSSKKEVKGSKKEKMDKKTPQNVKVSNANENIKIRAIKSNSKSQKKLSVKYVEPKIMKKSKSLTHFNEKQQKKPHKASLKEIDYQTPEMVQIENSYYFSNYDSKTPSSLKEDNSVRKKEENIKVPDRKKGMFLFESKEQEWREPRINFNLERTVDPFNW